MTTKDRNQSLVFKKDGFGSAKLMMINLEGTVLSAKLLNDTKTLMLLITITIYLLFIVITAV